MHHPLRKTLLFALLSLLVSSPIFAMELVPKHEKNSQGQETIGSLLARFNSPKYEKSLVDHLNEVRINNYKQHIGETLQDILPVQDLINQIIDDYLSPAEAAAIPAPDASIHIICPRPFSINSWHFTEQFENCQFEAEGSFQNCTFENCAFIDCDIARWRFTRCTLKNVRFTSCHVSDMVFVDCQLKNVHVHLGKIRINCCFCSKLYNLKFSSTVLLRGFFSCKQIPLITFIKSKIVKLEMPFQLFDPEERNQLGAISVVECTGNIPPVLLRESQKSLLRSCIEFFCSSYQRTACPCWWSSKDLRDFDLCNCTENPKIIIPILSVQVCCCPTGLCLYCCIFCRENPEITSSCCCCKGGKIKPA